MDDIHTGQIMITKYSWLMLALLCCTACGHAKEHNEPVNDTQTNPITTSKHSQVNAMQLLINGQTFDLTLTDSATATDFVRLAPFSLTMQDHLTNEKFATLPTALTQNDRKIGKIQVGDVLLWQGDTLVIFYEIFESEYHYTRLGKINNPQGLKQALGQGDVVVRVQ